MQVNCDIAIPPVETASCRRECWTYCLSDGYLLLSGGHVTGNAEIPEQRQLCFVRRSRVDAFARGQIDQPASAFCVQRTEKRLQRFDRVAEKAADAARCVINVRPGDELREFFER